MIKKLFSFFCLLLISFQLNAQIDANSQTNINKWRFGGNVGFNFGNDNSYSLSLYPMLGYQITPQLLGGATLGYSYQKRSYLKQSLFSGGPFLNYIIFPQIFAKAHLEYFNGKREIAKIKYNHDELALWLGGGYQTGGRIGFQVGVMYNLLYDKNSSVFNSPINTFGGVIFSL